MKNTYGQAACGGILQDSSGCWLSGFGANLGIAMVNEAELWGLFYGLHLAWNSAKRKIIVELDSRIILGWIQQEPPATHLLRALIHCYWQFLLRDWVIKFQLVYQEGNRITDYLAN